MTKKKKTVIRYWTDGKVLKWTAIDGHIGYFSCSDTRPLIERLKQLARKKDQDIEIVERR